STAGAYDSPFSSCSALRIRASSTVLLPSIRISATRTGREGLCRKPWACTGEADQTSAIPSTKRQDRRKTVILRKSVSFKKPGERIGRGVNRKAVRSSRDAGGARSTLPRVAKHNGKAGLI